MKVRWYWTRDPEEDAWRPTAVFAGETYMEHYSPIRGGPPGTLDPWDYGKPMEGNELIWGPEITDRDFICSLHGVDASFAFEADW